MLFWQKDINWQQVKASGVEYAFIRMAYRSAKEGKLGEDEYGMKNLVKAKAAGLKVNLIDGRFLDLSIVFDYEDGYYVENGFIDKTFNGVAKCIDKWYYVKNGKADLSYTGLAKNSNGW